MKNISVYRPTSIEEAIQILSRHGTEAGVYAGGTDLLIRLKADSRRRRAIWSISRRSITCAISRKILREAYRLAPRPKSLRSRTLIY